MKTAMLERVVRDRQSDAASSQLPCPASPIRVDRDRDFGMTSGEELRLVSTRTISAREHSEHPFRSIESFEQIGDPWSLAGASEGEIAYGHHRHGGTVDSEPPLGVEAVAHLC